MTHETLKCCLTFIGSCKSGLDYLKSSRALENVLAKCSWVLWFVLLCTELWKWAVPWSYFRISLKKNTVPAKKKSRNWWCFICHLCRCSCAVHQGECMQKDCIGIPYEIKKNNHRMDICHTFVTGFNHNCRHFKGIVYLVLYRTAKEVAILLKYWYCCLFAIWEYNINHSDVKRGSGSPGTQPVTQMCCSGSWLLFLLSTA